MKLGKYNRAIHDFAQVRGINRNDMKVLLALTDVMWLGINDLRYITMLSNKTVVDSLKVMTKHNLAKIARQANPQKGLSRMYSITQMGRDLTREFINTLN